MLSTTTSDAVVTDLWILSRMRSFDEHPAMVWNGQELSYRLFLELIDRSTEELETTKGESVALIGDYSPRLVALMFALWRRGNIVVPLTRGTRADTLLDLAEVEAVIELDTEDRAHFSRRTAPRTAPLLQDLRKRGEAGLIVFSSASTGQSKAILHSVDRLLEQYRRPRSTMRSLIFLLLDHLGGINTLLGILSSGGTAISISERTPESVCRAIEQWRVQLLPTSPTFLNMLLMSGIHERYDLSSLERITYGTEPMPESTLQRITALFPEVKIRQTYGLSELGVVRLRSEDRSLWLQLGDDGEGFATKIQGGTLWVKTATAMLGYLNHPSPFDAEGWMDTGDLVDIDGDRIRVLGRKSELINVGGAKVTPAEVESTILEMDNIQDVVVRGKANAVMGQIVIARVVLREPEDAALVQQRVRDFCASRLDRYKVPMIVEIGEAQHNDRFKRVRREL